MGLFSTLGKQFKSAGFGLKSALRGSNKRRVSIRSFFKSGFSKRIRKQSRRTGRTSRRRSFWRR